MGCGCGGGDHLPGITPEPSVSSNYESAPETEPVVSVPGRPDLRVHWYSLPSTAHAGCAEPDCPICLQSDGPAYTDPAPEPIPSQALHAWEDIERMRTSFSTVPSRMVVARQRWRRAVAAVRGRDLKLTQEWKDQLRSTDPSERNETAHTSDSGREAIGQTPSSRTAGESTTDHASDNDDIPTPDPSVVNRQVGLPPDGRWVHRKSSRLLGITRNGWYAPLDGKPVSSRHRYCGIRQLGSPSELILGDDPGDIAAGIVPVLIEAELPTEVSDSLDLDELLVEGRLSCEFIITGPAPVGDLYKLDQYIMAHMLVHRVPNTQVAVMAGDGRLVFASGFTCVGIMAEYSSKYYDGTPPIFTLPASTIFRMGSITKPITAAALVLEDERGTIALGDSAFDQMYRANNGTEYSLPRTSDLPAVLKHQVHLNAVRDRSRLVVTRDLQQITVANLLRHRPGWCDRVSNCPSAFAWTPEDKTREAAAHFGFVELPISRSAYIEYALSSGTGFALHNTDVAWLPPGGRKRYNNFGFMLAARLLESVHGGADFYVVLMANLLNPLGFRLVQRARTAIEDRFVSEAYYYPYDPEGLFKSRIRGAPAEGMEVPTQRDPEAYGGTWDLNMTDGGSGIVTNCVDLMRFADELSLRPPVSTSTSGTHTFHHRVFQRRATIVENIWTNLMEWATDSSQRGAVPVQSLDSSPNGFSSVTHQQFSALWHTGTRRGCNAGLYLFPNHDPMSSRQQLRVSRLGTTPASIVPAPVWARTRQLHGGAAFACVQNRIPPNDNDQRLIWWLRDVLAPPFRGVVAGHSFSRTPENTVSNWYLARPGAATDLWEYFGGR